MRYLILFFKFILLVVLLLIRTGEWDISGLYSRFRRGSDYQYYISAALSIAMFLILLDFVQVLVIWGYRRRHKVRGTDNFIIGIGHIYSLALVIGLVVGVLSLFRLDVREVFTSLSIIFAGLAILTKDYVSNLINGMIVTFSGQLSIGDNVSIGDHRGKIIDITLLNVHLLNDDDDVIYIPNNLMLSEEVINYTKREIKRNSIEFEVNLKFLDTVEELESLLLETVAPFGDVFQENSLYLRVAEVRKDSVQLKFQYILKEPNKEIERKIRRRIIRRIVGVISSREKFVDRIPDWTAEGSPDV